MRRKFIDLKGQEFTRLFVREWLAGEKWVCECCCGTLIKARHPNKRRAQARLRLWNLYFGIYVGRGKEVEQVGHIGRNGSTFADADYGLKWDNFGTQRLLAKRRI